MKTYYHVQSQGFYTLVDREVRRFLRIWVQTLLPTAMTTILYFTVFGQLLAHRSGSQAGLSYIEFMTPGLIVMGMINNSFNNVASSFFGSKFQRHIEEIIVSPLDPLTIMSGFVIGGAIRGLLVGAIVFFIAQCFDPHIIYAPLSSLLLAVLLTVFFSMAGLLNAIYARKFDDISVIPTFILTPMIYLGGVFYNASQVKGVLKIVTEINPFYYLVESFRYFLLGTAHASPHWAYLIIIPSIIALGLLNLRLLRKRIGMI